MQSLGIDLSTDPKKVWICEIDWGEPSPRIVALDQVTALPDPRVAGVDPGDRPRVRDEAGLVAALVERLAVFGPGPGRVAGIDAPFGWPVAFVDAICNWEAGDLQGFRKRTELRMRATDRFVQLASGVTPLSVSVDRIGSTAMLCAEVLSRYARRLDAPRLDRARALGGVAEVYPAAALRLWTGPGGAPLHAGGYKSGFHIREALVRELTGVLQPLPSRRPGYVGGPGSPFGSAPSYASDVWYDDEFDDLGAAPPGYAYLEPDAIPEVTQLHTYGAAGVHVPLQFRQALLDHDDALDAFLCALVARAVAVGRCHTIDRPAQVGELYVKRAASAREAERETQAERARAIQAEAAVSADAEGWIYVPLAGSIRDGLGLTDAQPVPEPGPAFLTGVPPAPEPVADDGEPAGAGGGAGEERELAA